MTCYNKQMTEIYTFMENLNIENIVEYISYIEKIFKKKILFHKYFNFSYFDKNFNLDFKIDFKIDIKNIFSESYTFSIFFLLKILLYLIIIL